MASGATVTLAFATTFTALALLFLALSFATDHWLEYSVNRDDLKAAGVSDAFLEEPWTFSRDRGLFRTCYSSKEATFLDDADDVTDNSCILEDGYQLESDDDKSDWPDEYESRIHLMRCHVGFFIFAMIMFMIGCIVGAVGCWKLSSRLTRIAGLIVFVGAFLTAGGMAFFHGYEYLERQKINEPAPEFPAYWDKSQNEGFPELQANSSIRYGYSYFFGWIGMALGAIAAILYLCAAYSLQPNTPPRRFYDDRPTKGNPYYDNRGGMDYPSRTGYGPTGYGNNPMLNPGYATTPGPANYPTKSFRAPTQAVYPTLPQQQGPRGYVY